LTVPGSHTLRQVSKAAALYFAIVFGIGFVLGPIRVLWVVPRLGERAAELIEAPIMLAAIILTARWIVGRFDVALRPSRSLGIGLIALGLMLGAELVFVLRLRGLSFPDYIRARDPVSGTVYLVTLGVFALMPLLIAQRRRKDRTAR
jgi:MFS family permease